MIDMLHVGPMCVIDMLHVGPMCVIDMLHVGPMCVIDMLYVGIRRLVVDRRSSVARVRMGRMPLRHPLRLSSLERTSLTLLQLW